MKIILSCGTLCCTRCLSFTFVTETYLCDYSNYADFWKVLYGAACCFLFVCCFNLTLPVKGQWVFFITLCYIILPPSLTTFPLPTQGESVFARCLSSLQTERVSASNELKGPATTKYTGNKKEFIEHIRKVMLGKW